MMVGREFLYENRDVERPRWNPEHRAEAPPREAVAQVQDEWLVPDELFKP